MSKHELERPGHLAEIKRIDEKACVSDLPAAAAAHEAPQLLLMVPPAPRRLLLESAERLKLALGIDDLLHRSGTEAADELVLEVFDADVEAMCLHVAASEVGGESGTLETAPEVGLFGGVAHARESEVESLRAEPVQESSDRLRTSDRNDRNALGAKISTTTMRKRFERDLVARPLDEHDRTPVHVSLH